MHGVSAYGLLVMTGRRSIPVRRKRMIAALAAIAIAVVLDFEGFAHAEASRGVPTTSVSTANAGGEVPADSPPDPPWAADESRLGTRPDAAH